MRPEVTLGQAQAAMKLAVEELRRKFPNWVGPRESATAVPLRDTVVSGVRSALLILLGAVGFVLLIACANVANLLLARATLRKRELAIRASMGAERWRIVSQLLTESLLLSLMGGALGLVIGFFGLRALLAINPVNLPRIGEHGAEITLDSRVLLYTLLVSLFTAILFGLVPTISATREDLNATLRDSGARSAEQDSVDFSRDGDGDGADPTRRSSANDSNFRGTAQREARIRRTQRADDADGPSRVAVQEDSRGGTDGARGRATGRGDAGSRGGGRGLLFAINGRPGLSVCDRRSCVSFWQLQRRRAMAQCFAAIFRGVSDPGAAWARVYHA